VDDLSKFSEAVLNSRDISEADRVIALSRLSEVGQEDLLSIPDKKVQEAILNLLSLNLIEEVDGGYQIKKTFD
jgi:hypothetical protein